MTAMLPSRPPGEDRATPAGEVVDPDTVLTRPAVGAEPRIVSTLRLPQRRRGREIVAVLDPVRARPGTEALDHADQRVVEAAAERLTAYLQPGELVAATDNNKQGDIYADRLLGLAEKAGCGVDRLRPVADDWNADLKMRTEEGDEEGGELPHARRSRQG